MSGHSHATAIRQAVTSFTSNTEASYFPVLVQVLYASYSLWKDISGQVVFLLPGSGLITVISTMNGDRGICPIFESQNNRINCITLGQNQLHLVHCAIADPPSKFAPIFQDKHPFRARNF